MNNFSNFCKYLKLDFTNFMEKVLPKGINRPTKKFIYDMVYGLLKTGSTHISEIARVLEPDNKLIHIEKRLTDNLSKLSLESIHDSLIDFSLNNLCKKPLVIDVDESDIVKPYGHKFEKLGIIHDGSKESRPKEKGYNVTGIVSIGLENTVVPLLIKIYSSSENDYVSLTTNTIYHLTRVYSKTKERTITTFDRGYDGSILMNEINQLGEKYVIRARSQRMYTIGNKHEAIDDICSRIKGKCSCCFTNSNGEKVIQKFSSIKPIHKDINHDFWLVVEVVNNDNDKRVYITNIDCSTKSNCEKVLKAYRMRWRIEEYFRFIKGEYGFEDFMVRKLKAINNLSLIIMIASTYITKLTISKTKEYRYCLNAYAAFDKKSSTQEIVDKYGQNGLMLYRIKKGIQSILAHSNSLPKVPGRDRVNRGYTQLSIFDLDKK